MKKTAIIASLLLLSACSGDQKQVDSQKILSALEGPKVPSVQDALMDSAKGAEKNGDYKQAIQLYQQILEKHPENTEASLALADNYRRNGNYDNAITIYDSLITKSDDIVPAKEGKALALISKGDFTTPVGILDEVMKVDPKRWKTLNALGILFATRNMHSEAQDYFMEALKYNPDSVTVLNNLGLSQALNGRFGTATSTLSKASSLATAGSEERKRVDMNTALVYAITGRLDEANAIASTYLTGAALDNNLGLYAHLAKDDQMAKSYLNMALTESKVFYEKAWDNLQEIDNSGSNVKSLAKPTGDNAVEKAKKASDPINAILNGSK